MSALACTGVALLAPARPPLAAAPQQLRCRPGRRVLAVVAAAPKARSEADLYRQDVKVGVSAPAPPAAKEGGPLAGQPWYVTAPLALVGVMAAARIARAIKKRM